MGQKVHRRRRYYRRGRSPWVPVLGWVLTAAILIPGSFFAAKWLSGRGEKLPVDTTDKGTVTTTVTGTPGATTTTTVLQPVTDGTVYKGFYLPYTKLMDGSLDKTLKDAAAAGFNAVVIELKNQNGNTYYVSETDAGKQAVASTGDAVSLKSLTDAFVKIRGAGLMPVPLLFAFEDAVAPRTIPGAKVTTEGHADWTWYDGDPQNGGKPWLNPYADPAQAYIVSLAEELQTAGAAAIMLDGVYFPTQTSQADFTSAGNGTLSKGQVLQQFISRLKTACDAPIIVRASANAALGNTTAGYEMTPTGLGANLIVADLREQSLGQRLAVGDEMLTVSNSAMGDIVTKAMDKLAEKCSVSSQAPAPQAAATISGDIDPQLSAFGKDRSYFVYDRDGNYDFTPVMPAQ